MGKNRRVAIVDGLRTPFVKSGTVFKDLSALDLSAAVVNELLQRAGVEGGQIDQVVYGSVIPDLEGPNLAREIVLRTDMPQTVDAYSVTRACATSTQALVNGTQAILTGDADIVIAGGADSLSKPPILYSDTFVDALMEANSAKDLPSKVRAFGSVRPKDLAPQPPALAERSTGLTMGESAEKMARENGITREDQDQYAYESHMKAVEAWEKGVYDDEVMHIPVNGYRDTVSRDGIPRAETTVEKLATLRPVFDRKYGTVTAGNSSPLTDGASAVLLMEEATAERLGFIPRAWVKSWAFAALDPSWQLLMGPSFATPIALDRAGMTLDDIDIIDMHEAFSAQMLSNMAAFASKEWAEKHLGRDKAIGEIPAEKLNPYGGSISLGHPFGATGTRQALTMANELVRRDSGTALITQCAAGGLGAAVVLER
ncbi:MAG: acetyl-CoA C-acyltransferase FadI [Acidimicrobiia bacterium]|nr:acetyl-CoA C-acyltransferase FadI [Acidimicrobiia bacterium]